jgi:phosphate-selective porin OprO/OprP
MVSMRFLLSVPVFFLLAFWSSSALAEEGEVVSQEEKVVKAEEAKAEDAVGRHIYWDQGINLTSPGDKVHLTIGGRLHYDFGTIDAADELRAAFPDFEGFHGVLRRLRVTLLGDWTNVLEFKLEIDLADLGDIKDNWVRFLHGRYLPYFTFGYFKEPFSLDALTSGNRTTFMEWSLPTRTFAPFRNIGTAASGTMKEKRMTWAAGVFFNSGSFTDAGSGSDRLTDSNGFNLTARFTGMPHYRDKGRSLTHLGASFSYGVRSDEEDDPSADFRTRPELQLTDDRLVETGSLRNSGRNLVSLEAAWKDGPLSLQGEYFHSFTDAAGNLDFNGWYVLGSWIVTGESRRYSPSGGIFGGIRPEKEFSLKKQHWGGLELALRFSQVDLNDGAVRGGLERNITAGLNWYLTRKHRFMVNYVHARVKDRADPLIDDSRADLIAARIQMSF